MSISVIIPIYNEEEILNYYLPKILEVVKNKAEIIIVDASDNPSTLDSWKETATVLRSNKGRSIQMNAGAKIATGEILYFIHLDSVLPVNVLSYIETATKAGKNVGCFRLKFDDTHWSMRFYGWCTRLPFLICRGGDQSLFITTKLFNQLDGFNSSLDVMEDIDMVSRIKAITSFHILKHNIITSARKYQRHGQFQLQLFFGLIHFMYKMNFSHNRIIKVYRDFLSLKKLN